MSEKYWHIKNCDLFRQLSEEQVRRVEMRSRAREFPRASPVYLPAQHSDSVLLLVRGRIKICHITPEGKQSILAFIDPGEIFGELAIFEPGQRDESAETVEKSLVVLIPSGEIHQLMSESPDLSIGITKLIGLRRRRIERRLKNMLFHSNRDRLIHLLLELAESYGEATPAGVELQIKLTHQELANVIGSTRETVTVLLGELQNEKFIKLTRRIITIVDLDRMAASVNTVPPTPAREQTPTRTQPSTGFK